jgi:hypothetical protein
MKRAENTKHITDRTISKSYSAYSGYTHVLVSTLAPSFTTQVALCRISPAYSLTDRWQRVKGNAGEVRRSERKDKLQSLTLGGTNKQGQLGQPCFFVAIM